MLADAPSKIPAPPEDTAEAQTTDTATQALIPHLPDSLSTHSSSPNRQALRNVLQPVVQQDNVINGLLALIDQAQHDVLIVSPYFVPGKDMKAAFARALERGVRLRILTNSLASNDAPLAHAGYARHRRDLLQMGVQLYELRSVQGGKIGVDTLRTATRKITGSQGHSRAMLHSKMLVLDHKLTVIGSMREAAWLLEDTPGGLVWRAPEDSDWGDQTREPDASLPLRMMIRIIGPLAPDHLL